MAQPARQLTRSIKLVIFDMDGTLTEPHSIDFARMRARCGVPPGRDILEHVEAHPEKDALHAIVAEEEALGLARTRLAAGVHDLLGALAQRRVATALLTRNNDVAMAAVTAQLPPFAVALSRTFTPTSRVGSPLHTISLSLSEHTD